MVNHPPKGSVQYHSNKGYLRQSFRLKVEQFIVLLRLKIFCLYLFYIKNIPLSSQTMIYITNYLPRLAKTFILAYCAIILMESLIIIYYIQQLPFYIKCYYAFFIHNYMFNHVSACKSMINIIRSFHIDCNLTRVLHLFRCTLPKHKVSLRRQCV